MCTLFKVNNKDDITAAVLVSFSYLWIYFTSFSIVSFVGFEQVNVWWVLLYKSNGLLTHILRTKLKNKSKNKTTRKIKEKTKQHALDIFQLPPNKNIWQNYNTAKTKYNSVDATGALYYSGYHSTSTCNRIRTCVHAGKNPAWGVSGIAMVPT